jgi:hypothetical protein
LGLIFLSVFCYISLREKSSSYYLWLIQQSDYSLRITHAQKECGEYDRVPVLFPGSRSKMDRNVEDWGLLHYYLPEYGHDTTIGLLKFLRGYQSNS